MSVRDREERGYCSLVDVGGGACPEDVRPCLRVLAGAAVRGEAGMKHRGQKSAMGSWDVRTRAGRTAPFPSPSHLPAASCFSCLHCCVTNHPKTQWLKAVVIMDDLSQFLRIQYSEAAPSGSFDSGSNMRPQSRGEGLGLRSSGKPSTAALPPVCSWSLQPNCSCGKAPVQEKGKSQWRLGHCL